MIKKYLLILALPAIFLTGCAELNSIIQSLLHRYNNSVRIPNSTAISFTLPRTYESGQLQSKNIDGEEVYWDENGKRIL